MAVAGLQYVPEYLPPWTHQLAARLVRDGLMPAAPDQLIVNEYPAGSGIPAHVDHAAFDDTIVSVSLGSSCVMDLTRLGESPSEAVFLEPRSARLADVPHDAAGPGRFLNPAGLP